MKIVINPKYEHLAQFVHSIPNGCPAEEVMRDGRNHICTSVADDGTRVVIKRFQVPRLMRRIIYTLSWSKARRSYKYAIRLEKAGIETAERIAYIETRRGGLFHTGYYITLQVEHPLLETIEQLPSKLMQQIEGDFAKYTAELHLKKISHRDYNPKNIFFYEQHGVYSFVLIDINRMRFGRLSKRRCIKEISRLTFSLPLMIAFTEKYAQVRGWDPLTTCTMLLVERSLNPYWRIKKMLKPVKRFFGLSK